MSALHTIGVILGWIFDWRVLAVLAVIGFVIVYRIFGRTLAVTAGIAALGLILTRWGFQRGARSEIAQQKKRDTELVNTRKKIEKSVSRAPPGEIRKRLSRWASEE